MAIITDMPECMTWQLCNPVHISYVLCRALFKYKQSLFRYENSHDKDMMVIRSYTIFLVPHLNLDIQWLHHAPKPYYIDRDQSMTFSTYCGLCSAKFTIYARWDIKVLWEWCFLEINTSVFLKKYCVRLSAAFCTYSLDPSVLYVSLSKHRYSFISI